jgi:hypothetical protein
MLTLRSVRRGLATAAITLPMAIMAAPAHAEEVRCTYTVGSEWAPVPVRENPDSNSVVDIYKNAGETVTSKHSCGYEVLDRESGIHFVSVNIDLAWDGEGWIRSRDLINPR